MESRWMEKEMGHVTFDNTSKTSTIRYEDAKGKVLGDVKVKDYDTFKYCTRSSHSSCMLHGVEMFEQSAIKYIHDDLKDYWNEKYEITDHLMERKWNESDIECRSRRIICLLDNPITIPKHLLGVEKVLTIGNDSRVKSWMNITCSGKHIDHLHFGYCTKHDVDWQLVAKIKLNERKFNLDAQWKDAVIEAWTRFFACKLHDAWYTTKRDVFKWLKKTVRKKRFKKHRDDDISFAVQRKVLEYLKNEIKRLSKK